MNYYSIGQACEDVADALVNIRTDVVMIRTALNDQLDSVSKDGFNIPCNFNQDKAVRRICRLIDDKRKRRR